MNARCGKGKKVEKSECSNEILLLKLYKENVFFIFNHVGSLPLNSLWFSLQNIFSEDKLGQEAE